MAFGLVEHLGVARLITVSTKVTYLEPRFLEITRERTKLKTENYISIYLSIYLSTVSIYSIYLSIYLLYAI